MWEVDEMSTLDGKPSREEFRQALALRHGQKIQEKVEKARVAVAGLGGLGSHVAVMLARAGVGHLHLVDFDRVDLSNLNRQAYWITHLGQYKTQAMAEIVRGINPYLEVEIHTARLGTENIPEIFRGDTLVCEAFDKAESKAMLVNTLLSSCPETIVVSGSGMAGYYSSNTIQTRRRMGRLYLCGDGQRGIEEGESLMAPRVTLCAAHQANMILRLLLGETQV